MGEANRIGPGRCPVCASPKARYTLSKNGLCVVTCNACNFQGFARSERSDSLLRELIASEAPPPVPADDNAPPSAAPMPPPLLRAPTPTPPKSERRSLMSW